MLLALDGCVQFRVTLGFQIEACGKTLIEASYSCQLTVHVAAPQLQLARSAQTLVIQSAARQA